MPFVPNSQVYLCNVPLDKTNQNQVKFANVQAQTTYFISKAVKPPFTDLTYLRKNNVLQMPIHVDSLWNCNYVMYRNNNPLFINRWFYAFITKMEYISEMHTDITIETDVWQTWQFDITLKESFIERQHQPIDTVGVNIIDEGLETGEYVLKNIMYTTEMNDLVVIAITSVNAFLSYDINTEDFKSLPTLNGVPSGLMFIWFNTVEQLADWLRAMKKAGKIDAVEGLFCYPRVFLGHDIPSEQYLVGDHVTIEKTIPRPTNINGYIPHNKKLMCAPYNYLYVSNRNGSSANYRYEFFQYDQPIVLRLDCGIMPSPVVKLTPTRYKGELLNVDEGLALGDYPPVSFTNSAYQTWLAQNQFAVPLGIAGGVLSTAVGIGTGNMIAGASGVMSIANSLSAVYSHSVMPDTAKGRPQGSVNIGMNTQNFAIYQSSITPHYLRILDDFFDMYGYKQNIVDIPNIASRPYWNFIKTIDINILGDIPNEDMITMKNMFNEGVTFWHNPSNIGNYSLINREPDNEGGNG